MRFLVWLGEDEYLFNFLKDKIYYSFLKGSLYKPRKRTVLPAKLMYVTYMVPGWGLTRYNRIWTEIYYGL